MTYIHTSFNIYIYIYIYIYIHIYIYIIYIYLHICYVYLIIIYITIVNGMVWPEVNSQKLDYLFKKLLLFEHDAESCKLASEK